MDRLIIGSFTNYQAMDCEQSTPERYFYDAEDFVFLNRLKEQWKDIYAEFLALERSAETSGRIHAWPEKGLYQNRLDEGEINKGIGWNVLGLYAFGKKREDNCRLCPLTNDLLEGFPSGPPTTAAFSILEPGTNILPHYGYAEYSSRILRCHLGLEVPCPANAQGVGDECCLKVGEDLYSWKEGELVVFDDSYIHQAWNHYRSRRVVLLLDFPRPLQYYREYPKEHEEQCTNGIVYLDKLTSEFGYND